MAFKMKGFSGFKKTPMKQVSPTYRKGSEPRFDQDGNLIERENAKLPPNYNYPEERQEYIDRNPRDRSNAEDYYNKNISVESKKFPGTYEAQSINPTSWKNRDIKTGWMFNRSGDRYAYGHGGHTERKKLDLARRGYTDIDSNVIKNRLGKDYAREDQFRTTDYNKDQEYGGSWALDRPTEKIDDAQSGVIVSRRNLSDEGKYERKGGVGDKFGRHQGWMRDWGSDAAFRDDKGRYIVENPEGRGFKTGFTGLEKNRITNARGHAIGRWSDPDKGMISGRKKHKGQTHHWVDEASGEGPKIESYMTGKKLAKTTQRDKGTKEFLKSGMEIKRDKVKRKGTGKKSRFVRKTGEGFLGLQNRKKYIDGVLQDKNTKTKKAKTKTKTKKSGGGFLGIKKAQNPTGKRVPSTIAERRKGLM